MREIENWDWEHRDKTFAIEDQSECSIWGGGGAKDVKNQSKSKKEELTMKRTNQNTGGGF